MQESIISATLACDVGTKPVVVSGVYFEGGLTRARRPYDEYESVTDSLDTSE